MFSWYVAAYSDLQCNSVTFNGQGQTIFYLSAKRLRRVCLRHAVDYRRCSLVPTLVPTVDLRRRGGCEVQQRANATTTSNGANNFGCAGKYQRAYYTYLPRAPHTRARTEYRRPASGCPRHNDVFPKNRVFPKKMVLLPSVVGAITTRTTESNQGRLVLRVRR